MSGDASSDWAFDQADLEALRESIASVLDSEADRLKLHAYIDGKSELDKVLWQKAIELGWLGIGLPEAYGGIGFGPLGLDMLHRELGRKVAPGPFAPTLAAAQTLLETADEAVKSEWLPKIAAGECSIAVPAKIATDAPTDKIWLLGDADAAAALAPIGKGAWGLVPLKGAKKVDMWDRTRSVLEANLSGAKPFATLAKGDLVANRLTRHLSLAICSDSIGGARAITEQTVAYMKERQQFGKAIASFQALKHRAADLMTFVVTGEEIVLQAVEGAATDHEDADLWAALAKAAITDRYVFIGQDCTQLHGGVGFTWEFDVHMHLKRARLAEALIAPNTAMRDRAAAQFEAAARAGRTVLELAT
jgi:alkylation response protein AidB-like acyl-CoA dehydrogenase